MIRNVTFIVVFVLFGCSLNAQDKNDNPFRIWKSGNEHYIAKIERSDENQVLLRTVDDELVELSIRDLDPEDQARLRKLVGPPPKPNVATSSQTRRIESSSVVAKKLLARYESVLADASIPLTDKQYVQSRLVELRPQADRDMVRLGKRFVDRSELAEIRDEAKQLVENWLTSGFFSEDPTHELGRLKRAEKIDPIANEASLLLGLFYTFYERSYADAARHFSGAIRRSEQYAELLSPMEQNNYIIALNNHAASLVRRGDTGRAFKVLERAVQANQQTDIGIFWNVKHINLLITHRAGLGLKVNAAVRKGLQNLERETLRNPPPDPVLDPLGWAYRLPDPLTGKKIPAFELPDSS